jgi:hypothetical protein
MALNAAGLESDLTALFADPPSTTAACAAAWAAAVSAYASGIVPASTTVTAAQAPLAASLTSAFGGADPATVSTAMEAAFLTFATSVGGGMAGFAGTPPVTPVGVAALAANQQATHAAAADAWASAIDTWMKTGIATLIAPPFTVTTWT